ncbi:MAG: zinc-dependent metalloprotease [Chitinophagaceae bacterium]
MKRILFTVIACALFSVFIIENATAQRNCGNPIFLENMKRDYPALYQQKQAEKAQQFAKALATVPTNSAKKTTAQYPIPVVFHFLLTDDEYIYCGRDSGIMRRVNSQIKGLNTDFNGGNADQNLIPAAFKSRFQNVSIQFGLAKMITSSTISNGIELKHLSAPSVYDVNHDCYTAKQNTSVGLAAWDPTKYLNIWVVNITSGGAGTVLGITSPPSNLGYNAGTPSNPHIITNTDFGIVLNYGAIGVREFPEQNFIPNIDKGRTLTHEMGHYFEMVHTWGDDGGLCPDNGGQDDGIADTPPEADATYGSPSYPLYDACTKVGSGTSIMFMNYMDYVDDAAMYMFTTQQGIVMQSYLQSESFSLTQQPGLVLGLKESIANNSISVVPNPATGKLHLSVEGSNHFLSADVMNMLGQSIAHITANGSNSFDIAVGNAARGIYMVKCQFAEGTLTRKIVLQ